MPLDVNRRKELLRLVPEGSLVSRSWLQDQHFSINAIMSLRTVITFKSSIKRFEVLSLKTNVFQ